MNFETMIANITRAVSLDRSFYKTAAATPAMSTESLQVVLIAAAAAGLGNLGSGFMAVLWSAALILIGYYIGTFLVQWIGAKFFNARATLPELQRAIGYAYAPNILGILAIIPLIGWLGALVGSVWAFVCIVIAIMAVNEQGVAGS
jgi:hypothetical protein